jgi:hypothetical protein
MLQSRASDMAVYQKSGCKSACIDGMPECWRVKEKERKKEREFALEEGLGRTNI